MFTPKTSRSAFTLVELLTVIAIIAVLMGILFPTIGAAIESAKKTQAKNDELQIVNAVKAYYTEYGKYPVLSTEQGTDKEFKAGGTSTDNLLNVLRANGQGRDNPTGPDNLNPRRIVFLEVPNVKVDTAGKRKNGVGGDGIFYDPWGNAYSIKIDSNYDNNLTNPYTSNAGPTTLNTGAIAWSIGRDSKGGSGDKSTGDQKDDVISWQ